MLFSVIFLREHVQSRVHTAENFSYKLLYFSLILIRSVNRTDYETRFLFSLTTPLDPLCLALTVSCYAAADFMSVGSAETTHPEHGVANTDLESDLYPLMNRWASSGLRVLFILYSWIFVKILVNDILVSAGLPGKT